MSISMMMLAISRYSFMYNSTVYDSIQIRCHTRQVLQMLLKLLNKRAYGTCEHQFVSEIWGT